MYTLTLASSLVLVALVLGLSYQILQYRKTARADTQVDQASVYAELGIRHALYFTFDDKNWRQHLNNGTWMQDITMGDAVYSVSGVDPIDGILNNSDADPVNLTCTAEVNGITRTSRVQTSQKASDLLRYALAATETITISNHVRVTGNVFTNSDIDKSGADTWIFGDAEAVDTIHEKKQITGDITENAEPKAFPGSADIFTYYQAQATEIPFTPLMERFLLSPQNNPYGPTNPDGVYKINCLNQKITIKDCRIVGTLILIKPKNDSKVESAINFRPARPDYPALIIDGSITLKPDKDLVEWNLGFDASLPGEPGFGTMFSVFPNLIRGLVYCKGYLLLDEECTIQGSVIVEGDLELKDWSACQYFSAVYDNPPPWFHETWLSPVRGTWCEVLPP